jgi:GTP-binding protein
LRIDAEFVTSAATAAGFPRHLLPEVAVVGRSNVGKSSLINALVGSRLARTSAAPGKTRLVNVYRVRRNPVAPFYLVDLPGYGYARGGPAAAREFRELTEQYFGRPRERPDSPARAALLLVDSRHAAMAADTAAWEWLQEQADQAAIVATKVDKLARGQRIRATSELESVFEHSVLPVSAVTGEGLDELWKLIDRLASSLKPKRRRPLSNSLNLPKAMAPPLTSPPRRLKR